MNLAIIPLRAYTLAGAYTGKFADLVESVALARMGKIHSVVGSCEIRLMKRLKTLRREKSSSVCSIPKAYRKR
jgi:hypothetical protein